MQEGQQPGRRNKRMWETRLQKHCISYGYRRGRRAVFLLAGCSIGVNGASRGAVATPDARLGRSRGLVAAGHSRQSATGLGKSKVMRAQGAQTIMNLELGLAGSGYGGLRWCGGFGQMCQIAAHLPRRAAV